AARHKPAPDPYLRAAELLSAVRPLVLEDSEAGVASGRAAGFEVLVIPNAAQTAELLRRRLSASAAPASGGWFRLLGEVLPRSGGAAFPFQGIQGRARALRGGLALGSAAAFSRVALGLLAGALGGLARFGRRQLYSCSARLGKSDGDCLLGGAGPVFALPDMFHFLANEFAGLGAGGLAFARILTRTLDGSFLWHNSKGAASGIPA